MRGPEYVRDVIRDMLAEMVPARLAMILAELEVDEPDPAEVSFVLADSLQELSPDMLPVVAVRSPGFVDEERAGSTAWLPQYDISVLVGCDLRVFGTEGHDRAGRARDRLLRAVRESVLSVHGIDNSGADGDVEFLRKRGNRARMGAGDPQTLAGLALSVGTYEFQVRVTEVLVPLVPLEPVEAVDLGVSGVDASQSV